VSAIQSTQFLGVDIIRWLEIALAITLTVLAAYIASWVIARALKWTGTPEVAAKRSARISKYAVYVLGAAFIIAYLAFDIIGALVGLGIFGVAIGIGLGSALANIVTGVIVLLSKTFKVGDEIKVAFFEGKVVKMGVQRVVLENKDGEIVFVPTGFFLTNPVSRKMQGYESAGMPKSQNEPSRSVS
jgi:small-conductance mechanosensitive channel